MGRSRWQGRTPPGSVSVLWRGTVLAGVELRLPLPCVVSGWGGAQMGVAPKEVSPASVSQQDLSP